MPEHVALPADGTRVRAVVPASDEYETPARDVTGTLATRYIHALDYVQCWVDGVQVDETTVKELEDDEDEDTRSGRDGDELSTNAEDIPDEDARALAQQYAELWNALQEADVDVPEAELHAADRELRGTDWHVDRDEKDTWHVRHASEIEGHTLAAERAPTGGVFIGGKQYKGGQFIPASVIAHATTEEKAALEKGKQPAQKKARAYQARGSVDTAGLRGRLSPHTDALEHALSRAELRSAAASWRMYHRHHGQLALHRVEEVTGLVERALANLDPEHPNAEGLRDYFGRQLAKFHHMLDKAQTAGVTGEVSDDDRLAAASETGAGGGVSAGEHLGEGTAAAPGEAVPGPGEGVGGGTGGLPANADLDGHAPGGESGEPGSAAGDGAGDGAGGTVPEAAGGRGPAGGVGAGGGHRANRRKSGASPGERSLAEPATPENPTDLAAGNWRYDSRDFYKGGPKAKFRANLEAIRTMRTIAAEGRDTATPEEQAVLSRYTGWGQLPALFNQHGDDNTSWEERQKLKATLSEEEWDARFSGHKWSEERQLLRKLLSDEEWDAARRSTLNAHYTHPDVVDAHWQIARKLGFDGGRFLETSAGIGYYLGLMPADLAGRTHSSAVELDKLTSGMLKLLYPRANVAAKGFEKVKSPKNFYDLVASNVPFGDYKVHDPEYNRHGANIHDYFFLKSADLVKPGGLVMHITSAGTMDKQDPKVRQELMKQCDLVSAVRFPAGAHKENAGTEVVTDLLVLRKRHPGEKPVDLNTPAPAEAEPKHSGFTGTTTDALGRLYHWQDGKRVPGPKWDDVVTVPDPAGGEPIAVNRYFSEHPEQVLGTLDRSGTMYAGNQASVSKTDDYHERLAAAIERLPEGVLKKGLIDSRQFTAASAPTPGEAKEGGYLIQDGKLFVREGDATVSQEVKPADLARIQAHLEVRDAARAVINDQLHGRDAGASRDELNRVYDAFVAEHGLLGDPKNRRVFRADPDSPFLLALEHYDAGAKTATKADIFHKDTVRYVGAAAKAETAGEALTVSLHEKGYLDVQRAAQLLGKTPEQVGADMVRQGIAYLDPQDGWKPADQYLSGNVRRKLALARAAAAADPRFAANVEALEKVQPEDIDHVDIDVKLGASWVPPSDVARFAADLLATNPDSFEVGYNPAAGQWAFDYSREGERWAAKGQQARVVWATRGKGFDELFEAAVNNTSVTVNTGDKDANGKAIVDRQATDDANAKIAEIREAFKNWVWEDDERRQRLHRFYNDNFNNIRTIHYDGSHQTFPGMNPAIELRDHQKNFVWQVVTTGKGLAAHEVGTGKTLSMIAGAMELRRLGLAKKPAIACLKANIEQITAEALRAYPGARILSTADMFDAASRQKTIARIATGDYDLILMTHDHLNMLPMKPEVVQGYIKDEIAELEGLLAEAKMGQDGKKAGKDRTVKAMEKAKANLEATLAKALDGSKKDNAIHFEESGIDHLFIDEAHKFKSLPCRTKQRDMKGVPTTRSNRATDMQMRTRWLMEQNGGRGVVFATGTPVANTMAELFNMQRYLQPEELKERGVHTFDAWASAFGEVRTKSEFTVSGEYKPVSRFAKFTNIPELMQVVRQVMDVQRADDMKDKDGKPVITRPRRRDEAIVAPKSLVMAQLMESLQQRAKALKSQRPGKGMDNMVVICTDGRKGALDMRLLDASAPDDPDSKTNMAVRKVLELHQARPGMAQLIFSDIGVNPIKAKGGAEGSAEETSDSDNGDVKSQLSALAGSNTSFHLYGDVIDKLVKGGIPRDKIADFSKLDGAKKEAAMEAMRRGDVLVGIGSTEKLGTGVNVQNKLGALHHLDVPWLPASVEQRDGRAWRQGNENANVDVYRYVSEGSLDQTFWQIIGNKTAFIKQVVTSSKPARVANEEDTEELSPEQLMAAASGDPRVMEKVNLDEEVKQLTAARQRHDREQSRFRETVASTTRNLPHLEKQTQRLRGDAAALEAHPDFSFEVGGKKYTERPAAAAAFKEWQKDLDTSTAIAHASQYRPLQAGSYRGLPLIAYEGTFYLQGKEGDHYKVGDSLASVEHQARSLARLADETEQATARSRADLERVKASVGKSFPKAQELEEKLTRARHLEAELSGKAPAPFHPSEVIGGRPTVAVRTNNGVRVHVLKDEAEAEQVLQAARSAGASVSRATLPQGMTFAQLQRQAERSYQDRGVALEDISYHQGPEQQSGRELSTDTTSSPVSVPSSADARTLAASYANLWNALQDADMGVPESELHNADQELKGSDWHVDWDDEASEWCVRHATELEGNTLAAERAPRGGVSIGGKQYKGGQFVPASVVASATPQEKAALERGKQPAEVKAAAHRARGSVNVNALRKRLAAHTETPLSRADVRGAGSAWRMFQRHHGELALHRVEELAALVQKAHANVDDEHPNAEGLRDYFSRQLGKYNHMLGLAEASGITGQVKEAAPKLAGKMKKKPTAPAIPAQPPAAKPPAEPPPAQDLAASAMDAVRPILARPTGEGQVHMEDVRQAMGGTRDEQDAELNRLWREGYLDLVQSSAVYELTPAQHAAAIDSSLDSTDIRRHHQNIAYVRPGIRMHAPELYDRAVKTGMDPEEASRQTRPEQLERMVQHLEREKAGAAKPAPAKPAPFDPVAHVPRLLNAVKQHGGKHNLADLVDVRKSLGDLSREQQDQVIHAAREQGYVTGSGYEGRHGVTPEQQAARHTGLKGDERIGFLSVRR